MEFTNKLINETSPYLLQHAHNPVNWYPWGNEAFEKAKLENKPIFLSIGYSTCHWCHVMERESFEDTQVANILNENYISIKVDKEERPDIDSVYMKACQAMTGSGGWPLTILMTPDQKPFFAGTYFPKNSLFNMVGLVDLLTKVNSKWHLEKNSIYSFADNMVDVLQKSHTKSSDPAIDCIQESYKSLCKQFDKDFGGFANAPKFPMAHNLDFLFEYSKLTNQDISMAEKTLVQMYKGGIFDHIGFGFSRYSTDSKWLVPHFEKMLYDNALLLMAYTKAYEITNNNFYKQVVYKTTKYIFRELLDASGGFYCAQDADSEGTEGKYYVFKPEEIINILGEQAGKLFNQKFDITTKGNFEGKSIPNLINTSHEASVSDDILQKLYEYRKSRYKLHLDDKILTSWNGLMIASLARASKVFNDSNFLDKAETAYKFIKQNLTKDNFIYTSYRNGKRTNTGFIDDYACFIYGLINLYEVTLNKLYLDDAVKFTNNALEQFYDYDNGGFYLYGKSSEKLFNKPKEVYDGAIPSGNSVMSYNLLMLSKYFKGSYDNVVKQQFDFMIIECSSYPSGNTFFLKALLLYNNPPKEIVCVLDDKTSIESLKDKFGLGNIIIIIDKNSEQYPLKDEKTTFYICENKRCIPPTNKL